MTNTIAIIGGGNLGASLAEGLLNSNFISPQQLWVTKRNIQSLQSLKLRGVQVTDQNLDAIQHATYIVLAVKPFPITEKSLPKYPCCGVTSRLTVLSGVVKAGDLTPV